MASSAIRQDDLLVQAASRGELEKVRAMLDHGAVVKGNNKMLTALHWAVTMGHRDVVALLIERGANVEAKAADGHTPLHMAAREGDAQMVQCLLEARANPNSTNNASQTAVDLALAFAEDEPEVAQVLLAAGALRSRQLLTAKPMPTRTPLLQMSEEVATSDGDTLSGGGGTLSGGGGTLSGGGGTLSGGGGTLSGGGGTLSGGGGSLLHGTYDEAAERAAFQAAVGQWRGPATGGTGTEQLESGMAALSTHAAPAPAPVRSQRTPEPASAARGTDDLASLLGGGGGGGGGDLESLMAGLVSQLSSEAKADTTESEAHVASLSGGGSTLSGVPLD
eukprot:scaffold101519_cov60-Phaeocystis_antarctica.AAC.8